MPWASFSMLDGPGRTGCDVPVRDEKHRKASAKTQVSLTKLLQSEVKIIHIIVQDQDGQNNNIPEQVTPRPERSIT